MAKVNERKIAEGILKYVGGSANAQKVYNCMTRVRVNVNHVDDVDITGLEGVEGVLGVVEDGNTIQIIVGPGTAAKVATEMADIGDVEQSGQIDENLDEELTASSRETAEQISAENKEKVRAGNKQSGFKNALNAIANIFVPLIPAFVGAGIIGGIASIILNMITAGTLDAGTWEQYRVILGVIQNGLFAYLNIYIGINAAKVFGATEGLGGVIAGVIYLNGMDPEAPLSNIFTGGDLAPGQGGVIGVIIAVYLLAFIEKRLRKVVPNSVDIIVTPTISLLVVGLITIFIIMPIAGTISTGLVGIINSVLEIGGAVAGFILGATFLPLVMFGLHQVLTPIHVEMINSMGQTNLLPILAMAGGGQVGAAIALWVRARKNEKLVNIIKGSLPVGILGIGEPLIYAVTLPLGRPFITACIGGGVGGAIIGAIGNVGATAIGPSGIALIPLIANGQWFSYVLGLLGAYAGGFIATYFFGVPEEAMQATKLEGSGSEDLDSLV